MHDLVKEVVADLVDQSEEYDNCPVAIKKVESEGYLLYSKSKDKVVAVGILNLLNEDGEMEDVLGAFSINVTKYNWAEAEGFSHDQMIDDLNSEIFALMGIDEVLPYLCS